MTTLTYQERFKTVKGVFDEFTNRNLFELQSRKFFDELKSPLFIGKESNVFLALAGDKKVIVKIYRVQNCDFNSMYSYIAKDYRYKSLKKNKRQIIFSWTQREFKNLTKAKLAGINCPTVHALKNNIIIEEMIGDESPSPQLKDCHPEDPEEFLNLLIKEIKNLYHDAKLVHGDLSAFNILNYNETPVLIDFSQSTVTKSPNHLELLERDLINVQKFFKKLKVDFDYKEVFNEIINKNK